MLRVGLGRLWGPRRSGGAFAGHADRVGRPTAQVSVAAELRLFLKPAHRSGPVRVGCDGISSLGHVVQSLGIPLTEVGRLAVNGRPVPPRYRPSGGGALAAGAAGRPPPAPPPPGAPHVPPPAPAGPRTRGR